GQIQQWNAARHRDGVTLRGFHAKNQACLRGALNVVAPSDDGLDLPAEARFGIFASPRSYPICLRLSNGVASLHHDALPDVRGLAIKVMGVQNSGTKLREDPSTSTTQDFLTTNSPAQLAANARGFMDFALAQASPNRFDMIRWFARNPRAGLTLLGRVTR